MDNLRTAEKQYKASALDNYALVLPVFNFSDKAAVAKMGQYAEITIKKASKTIQKHSMVFSGKEYVRWIDDAYMLIGKSYFYKSDYPMARRTFEFVIKTYNKNDIKYEAMLWQALSNIQLGDFNRAEPMLDMVMSKIKQGDAPDKYEEMTNLVYAQFYILQKKYPESVEFLNRALELNPKRDVKSRCIFILAQIDQMNGDLEQAAIRYKEVVKRNPSYEMEFNAKINLAECYVSSGTDREFIVKKLNKMVKDDKNKDHLDQIYYALSEIYLTDKDTATAIGLLGKSVATSKSNKYQKSLSALKLADIQFAKKDYPMAQAYYDSTMQFLPLDYPGYKDIKKKTETLTDLVGNLQTIQREDSLQRLASLPEAARNQVVDKIIAAIMEEEQKTAREEAERQELRNLFGPGGSSTSGITPTAGPGVGSWYFYNPSALSQGYSTFIQQWGRRKNEDLWFLSNKTQISFATETTEEDTTGMASADTTGGKKAAPRSTNRKERKFYTQDIPTTPEMLLASNNKIVQAYYNLGFIYVEDLSEYQKGIEAFETLNQRFPDNKYQVASYYKLYELYKSLGNDAQSNDYKNLILTKYSQTDFAKLLVNPNYYKDMQVKSKEASGLYEDTYKAFQNQQYYMVINNCDIASTKYSADSVLMPKFQYLKALSTGKIDVQDSMVSELNRIVKKYPKSEVVPLASNVLEYVKRSKMTRGQSMGTDTTKMEEEPLAVPYTFNPNSVHFFVLIVNNNLIDVNAQKIKIADFDDRFFDLDNLEVSSILLEGNQEMITVNSFPNSEKAMNYYRNIRENKYVFTKLESTGDYSEFVISAENYPVFYKNRNVSQYQRFFKKNYGE